MLSAFAGRVFIRAAQVAPAFGHWEIDKRFFVLSANPILTASRGVTGGMVSPAMGKVLAELFLSVVLGSLLFALADAFVATTWRLRGAAERASHGVWVE
jgi:hypothetical protein